jgi:hypothetical protein
MAIRAKIWEPIKRRLRELPDLTLHLPENVICRFYVCPFRKTCPGTNEKRDNRFVCNIKKLKESYLEEKEIDNWERHV